MQNPYETESKQMTPPPPPLAEEPLASRSRWPGVLGKICALFGGVAACLATLALLQHKARLQEFTTSFEGNAAALADLQKYGARLHFIFPATGLLLGLVCLAGGILLLQRKKTAKAVLIAWSFGKIAFAVQCFPVLKAMQPHLTEFMKGALGEKSGAPGPDASIIEMSSQLAVVMQPIWYSLLPIITLLWLRRKQVTQEIEGWRTTEQDLWEPV